jgi:ABC-type amino acid transport substrate-binding protein
VSKYAEESKPDLVVVQRIETGEEYGLAFAKESTKLRAEVRRVIEDMKEDGTFTEIYKKWFKEDPPDELFNTTTDESANNSGGGAY